MLVSMSDQYVSRSRLVLVLTSAVQAAVTNVLCQMEHSSTVLTVKINVCVCSQLSSCLTALIKTEKEAEVRRAAVHVITLLLRGLSDRTTQVQTHTHTFTTEYA